MMCDKPLEALDHCERAIRLSPLDPEMPTMQMEYGMALVLAGRDDEGLVPLNRAVTEMPALAPAYRFLIVALWRLNRMDLMRKAASKLLTVDPKYRISTHIRPFKSRTFLDHYVKALRAAGLPD
jgi:adenylate cyclase